MCGTVTRRVRLCPRGFVDRSFLFALLGEGTVMAALQWHRCWASLHPAVVILLSRCCCGVAAVPRCCSADAAAAATLQVVRWHRREKRKPKTTVLQHRLCWCRVSVVTTLAVLGFVPFDASFDASSQRGWGAHHFTDPVTGNALSVHGAKHGGHSRLLYIPEIVA